MHPLHRFFRPGVPLVALLLGGCAGQAAPPASSAGTAPLPGGSGTSAAITAADLRARVGILADDSLRGREVGSPGIASAARYLTGEAARLGLRPMGDNGTFLQRVPLTRTRTTAETNVERPSGAVSLSAADVLPVSGLGGLPSTGRTSASGPLVYGGYLQDPSVGPRELRMDQLAGAAVIVRLGAAPGSGAGQPAPRLPLASLFTPASPASAVLLVSEGENEDFWAYAEEIRRKGSVALPEQQAQGNGPLFYLVTPAAVERLLGGPLDAAREPRTSLGTFRSTLRVERTPVEAWNVVAALPGSDPQRAAQYVALGAHYDHVGVGEPVDGDSIYNGADDDASGTSALLEIAERFAAAPPPRSLLFVWHTAEEEGLLGSEYFTDHPTVPRGSVVTQLNIDMIGRNAADSVSLVGSRRLSTELGAWVEEVNRQQPQPFKLDYSFDAPNHPEHIYCRSDHYNYARYGIPVTFFTTGLHDDYHKPSDEPSTLDYDKLARVTRLVGDIAAAIASRPARPTVDQPVPPLGTPCS